MTTTTPRTGTEARTADRRRAHVHACCCLFCFLASRTAPPERGAKR